MTWFRRLLWLEIVATGGLGLLALVQPSLLVMFLSGARHPEGARILDGAFLLDRAGYLWLVLALLYVPAALRPRRYLAYALLACLVRLASVSVRYAVVLLLRSGGVATAIGVIDGAVSIVMLLLLVNGATDEQRRALERTLRLPSPAHVVRKLRGALARHKALWLAGGGVALVLFAVVGYTAWTHLLRRLPPERFPSDADRFKYASIVSLNGFPLYIWEVLPDVFADRFPRPGGWDAFGFDVESGREVPVGWAERTVGYRGLTPNCALCHTASYRTSPDSERVLVPGGESSRVDFAAFLEFLFAIADDERFDGATLVDAIEKRHSLDATERLLYKYVLTPGLRSFIGAAERDFAWIRARPDWGPGRMDAFNIIKFNLFRLPEDGTIGNADIKSIWYQRNQDNTLLQWNGSGTSTREANLFAVSLLTLAMPPALDRVEFDWLDNYLYDLEAPKYPFPVDSTRARAGAEIYDAHCMDCHSAGGETYGEVTHLAEIGTDPYFHAMWTPRIVKAIQAVDDPPFKYSGVQVSDGYVNLNLDGIWLRAPYLHNGSVPTLWDLLEEPAKRPASFHRGYDVYDPERVGFIAHGPDAEREGRLFTVQPNGNGNVGHEFGVDLPEEAKRDLLEYLKTL